MEEVRLIRREALDTDEPAHAFLRVGSTVYAVPALPEVELCPEDTVYFRGPIVAAMYGGTYLTKQTKRLIRSTLRHNPGYFTQLAARIRASNSIAPVAFIVHAKKTKGEAKRRK